MNKERWQRYSFSFQMGNIGAEISRAVALGQTESGKQSFERALELIDLTIEDPKNVHRLKELCRLREVAADYFCGKNEYQSKAGEWSAYFEPFAYAAAVERGL